MEKVEQRLKNGLKKILLGWKETNRGLIMEELQPQRMSEKDLKLKELMNMEAQAL